MEELTHLDRVIDASPATLTARVLLLEVVLSPPRPKLVKYLVPQARPHEVGERACATAV
jgi:hypothetical protein